MQAHKLTVIAFSLGVALAFGTPAKAADLPQSGSIKLHSGWKAVGETVQVGENHVLGTGNFWGVTFNDAGSGPLHKGVAICSYTLELMNGSGTNQGSCAWSDRDGDKFFVNYTGNIAASGENSGPAKITGGTGKFKGIQGQGGFECDPALNDKGQLSCTQHFEYSLTGAANK
jgi:hypothetical protein